MTTSTERYREARDQLLALMYDYDKAVQSFEWPRIADTFNWATDWFDVIARDNRRIALWIVEESGAERQITFAEMADRSNQVATWLSRLGIGKGDRVLLMLGNQVELWESMLAVAKLGAVVLPTTTALGPADVADRVRRGSATCIIANTDDAAKFDSTPIAGPRIGVGRSIEGWHRYSDSVGVEPVDSFAPATSADDPLMIYFTSGTSNEPKLVEHSQISYPVGHLSTMAWIGIRPGDVHLAISSPGWAKHAWSCFFAPWIAEATIFVYNYSRFDAAALLRQIRRAGVNTFCAPPTVWRMLIQAELGPKPLQLREILGAGEPLNPDVIAKVEQAWGLTIRDGFGQTETTLQIGNTPRQPLKPGSMGRPMPGVPVVLVDPLTGCRTDDEGEICLDLSQAPPGLMTGYLNDSQRNAQAMAGGYYHTGDIATVDADGYFTYVGRTDDIFKSSDYKVSPFELENVLIQHSAVVEAAIVPQPHETRLFIPKAYISLAKGWDPTAETAKSIMEFARDRLAPYLKVRRVEFAELPKTISGKTIRAQLRRREAEAHRTQVAITTEFRYEDLLN